jgi:hypothetical protein
MRNPFLFLLLGAAACAKAPTPTPTPVPSEATSAAQAPSGPAGDVVDADQVIARLRPVFRSCYQDGLREDAAMAGRVVFTVAVEEKGNVGSVAVATRSGGLSEAVVECMSLAIRKATFAPPTSGHVATLKVPISFVAAEADASLSEEEAGVKNAVVTTCVAGLRRHGATNEDGISGQCECTWRILRRSFSAAEINNPKLIEDPRFAAVKAETRNVCVPGAK